VKQQDVCFADIELSEWLLGSGIQSPEGHFYAWFNLENNAYVRPYPEITGYGISSLCWLFDVTGDVRLLDRARTAFRFLTADAIDPGWGLVGSRRLSSLRKQKGPQFLHAFDSGIVAAGLERLSARIPDASVRRACDRIADTFSRHLLRDDGTIWPLIDLRAEKPVSLSAKWSQCFSGYLLRSLMFSMLRGPERYGPEEASAVQLSAERVLAGQQACGAFPSYDSGETHLHPHLYTLEALTMASSVNGNLQWLERVTAGFRYLEHLLAQGRGLPTRADRYRITVPFERADIVAQFLRVGSYLCSVGCISRESLDSGLLWARRRLQDYVIAQGRHRGGVLFGQDWDGTFMRHVNSGTTLFSAQACQWYESARQGARLDPMQLI